MSTQTPSRILETLFESRALVGIPEQAEVEYFPKSTVMSGWKGLPSAGHLGYRELKILGCRLSVSLARHAEAQPPGRLR